MEVGGPSKHLLVNAQVNSKHQAKAFLDTGADRTVVHKRLVSKKDLSGRTMKVRTAISRAKLPLARTCIGIENQQQQMDTIVSDTLEQDMLLGRDSMKLFKYLMNQMKMWRAWKPSRTTRKVGSPTSLQTKPTQNWTQKRTVWLATWSPSTLTPLSSYR